VPPYVCLVAVQLRTTTESQSCPGIRRSQLALVQGHTTNLRRLLASEPGTQLLEDMVDYFFRLSSSSSGLSPEESGARKGCIEVRSEPAVTLGAYVACNREPREGIP